jgi:hypothetical protein
LDLLFVIIALAHAAFVKTIVSTTVRSTAIVASAIQFGAVTSSLSPLSFHIEFPKAYGVILEAAV